MAKKKSFLPPSLTTVMPFSKLLVAALFIALPFFAFKLGLEYREAMPEADTCESQFVSNATKLSFSYDACKWKVEEKNVNTSKYPENDSFEITATQLNNSNGAEVIIALNPMGMGGGYPDCGNFDYALVNNDVLRYSDNNSNEGMYSFKYLTSANKFATKNESPKEFEDYFTYMNKQAFDNPNMCWTGGEVGSIVRNDAEKFKESYQQRFTISVQARATNMEDSMKEADTFVVGFLKNIPIEK
jgi:hypothetical protein